MRLNKIHLKKNKKAFEMNFAWLFAIIAGAVILFLAIYITSKFVSTERYEIDTATVAKLSILLDPLETSLESGKSSLISFNQETRIYNKCFTTGNFGKQSISLASRSGIGKEWQEPGGDTQIYNKYIFSQDIEQGKEFSVFSMPFKFPFKVSDLIFFTAEKYCFVFSDSAAEDIKDEIENLNIKNIEILGTQNCSSDSKKVCFVGTSSASGGISECDVVVYGNDYELNKYDSGSVVKQGEILYYSGPLVYGAIFSEPEVYECNVKRLMLRTMQLSLLYKDKIKITERVGCSSVLETQLSELANSANALNSSQELLILKIKSDEIEEINNAAVCSLW